MHVCFGRMEFGHEKWGVHTCAPQVLVRQDGDGGGNGSRHYLRPPFILLPWPDVRGRSAVQCPKRMWGLKACKCSPGFIPLLSYLLYS